MFDCANVEMRELLPDLAAGTLDAATRARVEQHVAACAECASELDTLRLVRSAFGTAPAVDVARIAAALPRPAGAAPDARKTAPALPANRWMDWRVAAALTMITVGTLSLAVSERIGPRSEATAPDTAIAESVSRLPVGVPTDRPKASQPPPLPRVVPAPAARATPPAAQLSFGGGVGDLDDVSIRALLGALDEIDRAPVAPSAEPDRSPILQVIKEGQP